MFDGVLEYFWQTVGSQKHLLEYTDLKLQKLSQEVIARALKPLIQQRGRSFPLLLQEVEQERLQQLILASLEWEKQRPDFIVDSLEKTFTFSLSDIELTVRVDRKDRLQTQQTYCIIDYKTTIPSSKPWNEERLEHPQLPLYACLDENIDTVLFLELKAGHVRCSGISAHEQTTPGITPLKEGETWTDYTQTWYARLTQLADEFKAGECAPVPYRSQHCTHCDFHALCRTSLQGSV